MFNSHNYHTFSILEIASCTFLSDIRIENNPFKNGKILYPIHPSSDKALHRGLLDITPVPLMLTKKGFELT